MPYEWEKWEMPTQAERIAVVETKVTSIEAKLDDVEESVKSTKTDLLGQLDKMYHASCEQHALLAKKLEAVEKFNNKWAYIIMGGFAVASFVLANWDKISRILN